MLAQIVPHLSSQYNHPLKPSKQEDSSHSHLFKPLDRLTYLKSIRSNRLSYLESSQWIR
jgi:hypothetical protein